MGFLMNDIFWTRLDDDLDLQQFEYMRHYRDSLRSEATGLLILAENRRCILALITRRRLYNIGGLITPLNARRVHQMLFLLVITQDCMDLDVVTTLIRQTSRETRLLYEGVHPTRRP